MENLIIWEFEGKFFGEITIEKNENIIVELREVKIELGEKNNQK